MQSTSQNLTSTVQFRLPPTWINSARLAVYELAWDTAWKAAGLPTDYWTRRGPHNMRHTFLHRLRVAGVSEEDRGALAGHGTTLEQDYAWPEIEKLTGIAELATIRERTRGVILRRKVA